jgi:hypothetical protein
VRSLAVLLAVLLVAPAIAQERPAKKKTAAAKKKSHQKPTPEQIRRFNELEKKRQQ